MNPMEVPVTCLPPWKSECLWSLDCWRVRKLQLDWEHLFVRINKSSPEIVSRSPDNNFLRRFHQKEGENMKARAIDVIRILFSHYLRTAT